MNNNIPKYLPSRKDIFLKNKYNICINYNSEDDFHIAIYFLEKYKCKIIIRRLDCEEGWGLNLHIKIYNLIDNNQYELISLGSSEKNEKILYLYTNVILEPTIYAKQNIPKIIIQTSGTNTYNSLLHYNAVQTFLELNPEYEYYFYDDNDCRIFIKNNFKEDVLDAYDFLYPGAYKADLFRYCYIYINGGCYFDNKYILRKPLRYIINPGYDNLYCKDTKEYLMFNAIILAVPKLNHINRAIDEVVKNVKEKYYGLCSLSPTGPRLFNKYTHNKNVILKHLVFGKYYTESKILINNNNKLFANTHYKGYYHNQQFRRETYEDLFQTRTVYYLNHHKIDNYSIFVFPHNNTDTFNFEIEDTNHIKIRRTDKDNGWGMNLRLKIINNNTDIVEILNIGSSQNNIISQEIHN